MPGTVLTIKEVAAVLRLADKTVYSMAHAGELPAFKVRGQWRVRGSDFDDWMEKQTQHRDRKDESSDAPEAVKP